TRRTCPIDTRTLLRYSGSAHDAPSSTPSTPNAAALRNIAPRFSWSLTPSSTASTRAFATTSSHVGLGARSATASTPRLRWKPTTPDRICAEGTYAGAFTVARSSAGSALRWGPPSSARTGYGESSSRRTTTVPSAITRPRPPGRSGLRSAVVRSRKSSRRGSAASSTSISKATHGSVALLRLTGYRYSERWVAQAYERSFECNALTPSDGVHRFGR